MRYFKSPRDNLVENINVWQKATYFSNHDDKKGIISIVHIYIHNILNSAEWEEETLFIILVSI